MITSYLPVRSLSFPLRRGGRVVACFPLVRSAWKRVMHLRNPFPEEGFSRRVMGCFGHPSLMLQTGRSFPGPLLLLRTNMGPFPVREYLWRATSDPLLFSSAVFWIGCLRSFFLLLVEKLFVRTPLLAISGAHVFCRCTVFDSLRPSRPSLNPFLWTTGPAAIIPFAFPLPFDGKASDMSFFHECPGPLERFMSEKQVEHRTKFFSNSSPRFTARHPSDSYLTSGVKRKR